MLLALLPFLGAQVDLGTRNFKPATVTATPSYTGNTCAGTGFTQSCTITGVTAGDAIVFYTTTFGASLLTPLPACADSVGTPVTVQTGTWYSSTFGEIAVCVLENASSGSHTPSALCTGCNFGDFYAYEFTGVPTSGVTEGATINTSSTTGPPPTCASTTTTGSNDLLFNAVGVNGGTPVAPTTPTAFTQLATTAGQSSSAYSTATVGAGSYTPTWTVTGTTPTFTVAVCFGIK